MNKIINIVYLNIFIYFFSNYIGSDGKEYCWVQKKSEILDRTCKDTIKFGGGSIMVWGCMTSLGPGYSCKIDNIMDAQLYVDILNDDLIETLNFYDLNRNQVIFQQDNDPKHTSRLAKNWFQNNNINILPWPSQSPDLNPIEHLWFQVKQALIKNYPECTSITNLWERFQDEWNKISVDQCLKLIDSMPQRCQAVIKAKGGPTKY